MEQKGALAESVDGFKSGIKKAYDSLDKGAIIVFNTIMAIAYPMMLPEDIETASPGTYAVASALIAGVVDNSKKHADQIKNSAKSGEPLLQVMAKEHPFRKEWPMSIVTGGIGMGIGAGALAGAFVRATTGSNHAAAVTEMVVGYSVSALMTAYPSDDKNAPKPSQP